jgi:hypothetical protein
MSKGQQTNDFLECWDDTLFLPSLVPVANDEIMFDLVPPPPTSLVNKSWGSCWVHELERNECHWFFF